MISKFYFNIMANILNRGRQIYKPTTTQTSEVDTIKKKKFLKMKFLMLTKAVKHCNNSNVIKYYY